MSEIKLILDRALPSIARRMENELKIACPVDTGRLRNSIKVQPTEEGLKIWMVEYGRSVEFGVLPHIIRPKNKKALHWGGKDGPIVKQVNHPGTRPNPFIRGTINFKLRNIIKEELLEQQSL